MKKLFPTLLLVASLFIAPTAFSQGFAFTSDTLATSQATLGDTSIFYSDTLVNNGPNLTSIDTLRFFAQCFGSAGQDTTPFEIPASLKAPPILQIPVGGRRGFTFRVPVKSPFMKVGSNVVVIWPRIHSTNVKNVKIVLYLIVSPNGIAELVEVLDHVVITSTTIQLLSKGPEQVRIFNLSGSVVWEKNCEPYHFISTSDFPRGLYFVETTDAKGNRQAGKLLLN